MSEKLDGMKIAKIVAAALIAVGTIAQASLNFVTNQNEIRNNKEER